MEFFNDVGGDPLKPSLFELVAQDQLRDRLQPAIKYVWVVFAQRYPRYILPILNRHEEFYALIMFFVERHYLWKHNASFAENFYGLKRRRKPWIETDRAKAAVSGIPAGDALRTREVWRSIVFLVGIPYLRTKAQNYYEELGGGIDTDIVDDSHALTNHNITDRLRRGFKKAYPWLNISFEVWLLASNIAYLFDRTPFYRPWLAWVGVDLCRLGVDDFRQAARLAHSSPSPSTRKGVLNILKTLLKRSPQLIFDSLRLLLPTSIFFVKFLEWWYSPTSPARSLTTSPLEPAVPPPKMLPPHPRGIPMDVEYGICAICMGPIRNATAMPSGYVFCYRCSVEWVEREGRCPATLIPLQVWQLRKVMV